MPCLVTIQCSSAHSQICGKSCIYSLAPLSHFPPGPQFGFCPISLQKCSASDSVHQSLLISQGNLPADRVSHPPFLIPSYAPNPPAVSRVNKEGVAFHTFLLCAYISTYIVYEDMFCMSGFFFV